MNIARPPTKIERLAQQLKLLANPKRLQIVHLLMEGVQCNCELGDALGMPPNLISHHLRVLREADLVNAERDPNDARWIYYSINRESLEELNKLFGSVFDPGRIKERHPACGPQSATIGAAEILSSA